MGSNLCCLWVKLVTLSSGGVGVEPVLAHPRNVFYIATHLHVKQQWPKVKISQWSPLFV